jgi:outer membrane lipase/esterase
MKTFTKLCILAAIFTSFNAVADSHFPFSNIFLFGDSLSDVGNGEGSPDTNGGGALWANDLAQDFGLSVSPSSKGGNDYADTGAITGQLPFNIPTNPSLVTKQTAKYLSYTGGRANPHSLYTIIAGSNDVADALELGYIGNSSPQSNAITLINMSTNNILDAVTQLHNAGAKYILVGNLPNLGMTPRVQSLGPQTAGEASQLSQSYNNALLSKLNGTGYNIIQIDIFGLLNAIQNNSSRFGFLGPYSSYCKPFNPTSCSGNPNQYIFFDGFHPSQATGIIFADYVLSVLQGPEYAGILAEAPLGVIDNQNSMIQSELLGVQTNLTNLEVGKWRVFANGLYNPETQTQNGFNQQGFNVDNKAFIVGADYRFNQNGIFGFAAGRSMGNVDFSHNAGGFDLNENLITLFGGYQFLDNAYINTELTYGNIDYSNINRRFMLGTVPETVDGNTTGDQYGAAGNLGYNFNFMNNNLKTGPVMTLDYQHILVNPYSEQSSLFQTADGAFDALQYNKQTNDSFLGGLGWQISYHGQINNVQVLPFLQATYNHQFLNMDRSVEAGVTSLPGSLFSMPVSQPDKDFGLINTGIQGIFNSGLALTFGYNLTVGQSDLSNQAFMISASMPL